jgi:catechol 2,3-dioxygenase-like lactoylglutathione lyase family enzyme
VVSSAVLYVKELDRMQAFYAGCFGLELVERDSDFAVLTSGERELALVVVPDEIAAQIQLTDPPTRREQVPVKLAFPVDSIEAGRKVLRHLGGAVDDPATEWEFRGMLRCDAIDPEGNVIQLLQQIGELPAG